MIVRVVFAFVGSIIGAAVAAAMLLVIHGEVALTPVSSLMWSLSPGALIGAILGFRYYKIAMNVSEFLYNMFF